MACVFAVRVQSWLSIMSVAIQSWKEAANLSPFTNYVGSTGAIAVSALEICLDSRSKSKNRDKLIYFIVRVMGQALFFCLVTS
jgi:hypothetical protein